MLVCCLILEHYTEYFKYPSQLNLWLLDILLHSFIKLCLWYVIDQDRNVFRVTNIMPLPLTTWINGKFVTKLWPNFWWNSNKLKLYIFLPQLIYKNPASLCIFRWAHRDASRVLPCGILAKCLACPTIVQLHGPKCPTFWQHHLTKIENDTISHNINITYHQFDL